MHYRPAMLSSKQRAYLQGLAHDKKPVILLGHKGITAAVIAETKGALLAHELVKCRLAESGTLDADAQLLAEGAGAELVARLGRMAILFKAHPEKKKQQIRLPGPKKRGLFDVHEDIASVAGPSANPKAGAADARAADAVDPDAVAPDAVAPDAVDSGAADPLEN